MVRLRNICINTLHKGDNDNDDDDDDDDDDNNNNKVIKFIVKVIFSPLHFLRIQQSRYTVCQGTLVTGKVTVWPEGFRSLTITNLIHTCFILQYVYYNPLYVSSSLCSSSGG